MGENAGSAGWTRPVTLQRDVPITHYADLTGLTGNGNED